jgi:hypothetical protein
MSTEPNKGPLGPLFFCVMQNMVQSGIKQFSMSNNLENLPANSVE